MKTNSEKLNGLMGLCSLLGIIGLILMFLSSIFGRSIAWSLASENGIADTSEYQFISAAITNNFLVAGGILFAVNLTMFLFAYYKKLDIKE